MKRMNNRDARWAKRRLDHLVKQIARSLAVQALDLMDRSDRMAADALDLQRASDALQRR